jgi:hypothetical protein
MSGRVGRMRTWSAGTRRLTSWPGKSRYTAPGRPSTALPSARWTYSGIRAALSICWTHLQPGRANATWSASWKPPSPRIIPYTEPPSTTSGIALSVATWSGVTALVIPGPEPTTNTPGLRRT